MSESSGGCVGSKASVEVAAPPRRPQPGPAASVPCAPGKKHTKVPESRARWEACLQTLALPCSTLSQSALPRPQLPLCAMGQLCRVLREGAGRAGVSPLGIHLFPQNDVCVFSP